MAVGFKDCLSLDRFSYLFLEALSVSLPPGWPPSAFITNFSIVPSLNPVQGKGSIRNSGLDDSHVAALSCSLASWSLAD